MEALIATILERILDDGVLDAADLARVTHTSRRAVARWCAGERSPARDTEERLLETTAVVDFLRTHLRRDAARLWIRSPNSDLGYAKPIDLIAGGEYMRVIGVVLSMAEGVPV
ncbi:MAG: hypothetical protein WD271_04320 [Acidimicrobiia bacterium]